MSNRKITTLCPETLDDPARLDLDSGNSASILSTPEKVGTDIEVSGEAE